MIYLYIIIFIVFALRPAPSPSHHRELVSSLRSHPARSPVPLQLARQLESFCIEPLGGLLEEEEASSAAAAEQQWQ